VSALALGIAMIDLVTLLRRLAAPLLEEEPEPYWTSDREGDLAEKPSPKAAETIARALAHRPARPPGK
jgi:hypothetical protein